MKLLMVVLHMPWPTSGASTRNYQLLKALVREHAVTVLVLSGRREATIRRDASRLEDLADSVQVIPRPRSRSKRVHQLMSLARGKSYLMTANTVATMQAALDEICSREHFGAVLFESVLLAGYRLPPTVKVIIDQQNIEHELLQRTYQGEQLGLRKWYSLLEGQRLKPIEIQRCGSADMVLVTSERERQVLKDLLPQSAIEVVSNGVDIEFFQPQPERCGDLREDASGAGGSPRDVERRDTSAQVTFTGTMDYFPNVDAVLFFAEKCWPRVRARAPEATWYIVGSNPPPEVRKLAELPGVIVTGTVPDVRPYLAASSVAIAPLLVGGGTRLKILEAFAMGKAVVATSLGCEGLSVVSGEHLIIADTPEAFTEATVMLLRDSEMRQRLAAAGRSLVEAEYSWERSGAHLLDVLRDVCG